MENTPEKEEQAYCYDIAESVFLNESHKDIVGLGEGVPFMLLDDEVRGCPGISNENDYLEIREEHRAVDGKNSESPFTFYLSEDANSRQVIKEIEKNGRWNDIKMTLGNTNSDLEGYIEEYELIREKVVEEIRKGEYHEYSYGNKNVTKLSQVISNTFQTILSGLPLSVFSDEDTESDDTVSSLDSDKIERKRASDLLDTVDLDDMEEEMEDESVMHRQVKTGVKAYLDTEAEGLSDDIEEETVDEDTELRDFVAHEDQPNDESNAIGAFAEDINREEEVNLRKLKRKFKKSRQDKLRAGLGLKGHQSQIQPIVLDSISEESQSAESEDRNLEVDSMLLGSTFISEPCQEAQSIFALKAGGKIKPANKLTRFANNAEALSRTEKKTDNKERGFIEKE
ncbi:hypothetical protein PAEPH01_0091 [Pancytospora epiphaga]|nr:hypothetical protein PAEPH01_0091 [Pancytospora epiphaga]